eukprot:3051484-Pyramimonas_sp.AAC.1
MPGIPGPQGGDSSGVVILARDWLVLYEVEGGDLCDGRALACVVHAPASPPVCLCSLYLEHSVGHDSSNSGVLVKLGGSLTKLDCEF